MARVKLDENLSDRVAQIFTACGHDVATVPSEGLQGRPDETVYGACQAEGRCLVTLDLGFANVLRFPPALSGGIIGNLWIVEPGRVRVHEPYQDGEAH